MAETVYLTDNALTRKRWAKDLFKILLPSTEINDLVGTGSEAILQTRTELGKGDGDQITFGIMLPLTGEGVVGRDPVEGSEEEMVSRDFSVTIEELNHAVSTGGKMDQQRIPYDLMQTAKTGLQYWWAEKLSDYAFAVLGGDSSFRIAGKVFAQAISEPDTDHHMKVNDVAEASMSSADTLTLAFLDRVKQRAELPVTAECYKIRPLMIGGKKYYRVFLHNYCFDALRENTNVGQWGDLLRNANKLGIPNVEIEYNGMLISKSERVRQVVEDATTSTNGVFRNFLCGAQAAVMPWGGAGESKGTVMAFVPYERDAKRFVYVRGGGIFSIEKTRFADHDYGVIAMSAWGEALS